MPILGIIASSKLVDSSSFMSIATVTAAGGEGTMSFTSIPGTYKHLQIRSYAADTYVPPTTPGASGADIRFNSDTGNNYSYVRLYSDGTTVDSSSNVNTTSISSLIGSAWLLSGTHNFSPSVADIFDYQNTSKFKSAKGFSGARDNSTSTNQQMILGTALWYSTAAITRIDILAAISGWKAGSTFALYGIKG